MSWPSGINNTNLDNSDNYLKPKQAQENTNEAFAVFDFNADAKNSNVGLDAFMTSEDENPNLSYNTLLAMLEAGEPIEKILSAYPNEVLEKYIISNADIKKYFLENPEYKAFYENDFQTGKISKLIELYNTDTSVTNISKALNDKKSYPLDLSKNKNEIKDLLSEIKARFNTASFSEKKEIISQLEKMTGISLKNLYKDKEGYDLNRLFAVIYSLADKITSLSENDSLIIDGENVSGEENIVKGINAQIDKIVKSSKAPVMSLLQSFSGVCRESLIRKNRDDDDSALKDSIDMVTKNKTTFARKLRKRYKELLKYADPQKKEEASNILNPELKVKDFLNINEYIQKVTEAIKVLDNNFDEKEFAKELQNEFVTNNIKTNGYLLKIYSEYIEIKDKYNALLVKEDKSEADIELLSKYEQLHKRYVDYIQANHISEDDLKLLNSEELIDLNEIEINDEAIKFLDNQNGSHKIRSNIVHFAVRKNKIDNNPHIKAMIDEVFSAVPEIKNKSHAEALQILQELKNNSENQDRLDIIDNLIESFEILNEDDLAKIGKWHEMITIGATDEELKQVIDSLVQDIKTRYPDKELDESAIATMISNYIISSCDQRYNEKIFYITDYILNNYDVEELNDIHYISITASQNENLTKEQASYFVNKAKEAGEINKQKLYMVGTQGESVMSEMSTWEDLDPEIRSYMESLINNDYNGNYSDDFKEEIMHNLGYSDYCASTDSSGSPNSLGDSYSLDQYGEYIAPNIANPDYSVDKGPKNSHETLNNDENKIKDKIKLLMATNPLFADKIFQKDPKVQTLRQIIEEGVDENGDPVRDSERQEATLYLWKISPNKVYELERGAENGAAKFFLKVPDFDKYIILTQNRTKRVYDKVKKENATFYDYQQLKQKEMQNTFTGITKQ